MKKKRLVFFALMTCLLVYGLGNQVLSAKTNEDELVEKLFEGDIVFNESATEYGVNGFGVSKSDKQLRVVIDSEDPAVRKEVKRYFDNKLENIGVNNYKVNVF